MSKTFTSRPAVTTRGRGTTRRSGNQNFNASRGRGVSGRGTSKPNRTSRAGGMYSQQNLGGARSRPTRGITLDDDQPQFQTEFDGSTLQSPSQEQETLERRMTYQGGYSMLTPNPIKRQQISEQARKETDEFERYKNENKPNYVSYHGTVGGGHISEMESRRKAAQNHADAKLQRLQRQQNAREDRRRQEEGVYAEKKLAARCQSELNEQRKQEEAKRQQQQWDEDRRRKNNAFLDKLEKKSSNSRLSSGEIKHHF